MQYCIFTMMIIFLVWQLYVCVLTLLVPNNTDLMTTGIGAGDKKRPYTSTAYFGNTITALHIQLAIDPKKILEGWIQPTVNNGFKYKRKLPVIYYKEILKIANPLYSLNYYCPQKIVFSYRYIVSSNFRYHTILLDIFGQSMLQLYIILY